jgi:hypothetical protein
MTESKSKLCYDWRLAGLSCLGVKHPSGAYDQIFITVRHLRVCWCGALSLTRERVCLLQLPLVLASAVILGSESRGTRDHILLSEIRDSQPIWRARSPYLYPPGTGWPSSKWKWKSHCDWRKNMPLTFNVFYTQCQKKKRCRAIVAPRRHIVAAKHTSIRQALQSMEYGFPRYVIIRHSEGYYVGLITVKTVV